MLKNARTVRLLAALVGGIIPSSQTGATEQIDPTFRKALNYAFTGDTEKDLLTVIDLRSCVFQHGTFVFHLNNVVLEDTKIGEIQSGNSKYTGVILKGDKPVIFHMQANFDQDGKVVNRSPKPRNDWGFGVPAADPDKLKRAWSYLSKNGCSPARPEF